MTDEPVQAQQAAPASSAPSAPSEVPQPEAPSSGDVSRNTIIMLVLLTLVISILGTWTVLNEVSSVKIGTFANAPASPQANVKLNILSQDQYSAQLAQSKQPQGLSTGHVILNILRQ